MRGWWFWGGWAGREGRGGGLAGPPIISGRKEYPGLAEKELKTSSLHHPQPHRDCPHLPSCHPAQRPTLHAPAAAPRREVPYTVASRQLTEAERDRDSRAGCRVSTRAVGRCPWPAVPEHGHRDPVLPIATFSSGFRDRRKRFQTAGQAPGDSEGLPGCRNRCAPNQQPGRPNCQPHHHSWLILFPPLGLSQPLTLVLKEQ